MKAKLKIKFKRAPIFIITCIALLGLLGFLGYRYVTRGDYLMTALVAIMSAVIPLFLISRFFHGIRINEKRVLIISQDSVKRLPREDISSITVTFDSDLIRAEACLVNGNKYQFVWQDSASDVPFDEVTQAFSSFEFITVERSEPPTSEVPVSHSTEDVEGE